MELSAETSAPNGRAPRAPADLPPLPLTLAPLVRAATSPDTSAAQLADLCERDPSVAVRVLRLANSAAYCPPRPITSVHRAVVLLGTRALANLALSLALVEMIPRARERQVFDSRAFLRRALRQAVVARLLAPRFGRVDRSDAFTAGLCLDIGYLAYVHLDADRGGLTWAETRDQPAHLGIPLEEQRFGTAHPRMGAEMVSAWGLPADLSRAIDRHHQAGGDSEPPLVQVASLAAAVAAVAEGNAGPDGIEGARLRLSALGGSVLDEVLPRVAPEVDELAQVFDADIGQEAPWEDLFRVAVNGLVNLNLAYEDRVRTAESEAAERARQADALARANAELVEAAVTDPLTGLPNRRRLDDVIDGENPSRAGLSRAVVMVDVDHFKSVNDRYGHDVGDEVLRHCADVLSRAAPQARLVARYGGEEFVVVVDGRPEDGRRVAESCREALERAPAETSKGRVRVTASFGVAASDPRVRTCGGGLLKYADQALYEAKRRGRNRVCVHPRLVA